MDNYDLRNTEWHNIRERFAPPPRLEPVIDEEISKIVGRKIYATDPRLLKLVVKYKQGKSPDSKEPDNFLKNPRFIDELKRTLSGDLK